MKNIYLYDPEVCDGDFCPIDCDHCYKADKIIEKNEKEENEDDY